MSTEFETKRELEAKRRNIKTFEDLTEFLADVENNYNCGYGDAPRAIAQACLAIGWYLSNKFGITGFQAGFVMWDFVRGWSKTNNKTGLRLVDYDDMLYPQYSDKFDKTISKETWESIQKEAAKLLEEHENGVNPVVYNHWKSIVDGNIPFGYTLSNN